MVDTAVLNPGVQNERASSSLALTPKIKFVNNY